MMIDMAADAEGAEDEIGDVDRWSKEPSQTVRALVIASSRTE